MHSGAKTVPRNSSEPDSLKARLQKKKQEEKNREKSRQSHQQKKVRGGR